MIAAALNTARHPWRFAAWTMLAYLLLLLPALGLNRFDVSAFIMAGDHFVDAEALASPIIVHRISTGYDGQFYYRLALAPFSLATERGGVQFDQPAWRMQRIVYPALSWLLSGGRPGLVPAALLVVNLLGLGAIAAASAALARQASLPPSLALAIVLWPGFIIALTHDTTEIVAAAFVLTAILCRLRGRQAAYALCGALSILTRETTATVFAGLLLWDGVAALRRRGGVSWVQYGICIFLPCLVWRQILSAAWHMTPQEESLTPNLGPPFFGVIDMLIACLTGSRLWASTPARNDVVRAIVLPTAPAILAFCGAVARRVPALLRSGTTLAPLALCWCGTAALMSLLTAEGPWIDPDAYFRAFTECYVTGCLVIGAGGVGVIGAGGVGPFWTRGKMLFGAAVFATVWIYCLVQLRPA